MQREVYIKNPFHSSFTYLLIYMGNKFCFHNNFLSGNTGLHNLLSLVIDVPSLWGLNKLLAFTTEQVMEQSG